MQLAEFASMIASPVTAYSRRAQKGRVVFTSFHGRSYRGNPKRLFEQLLATGRLDPVWLSTSQDVVNQLRERFGEQRAHAMYSGEGLKQLAEAEALIINHGTSDFPHLHLSRKALVVQTFHGLPTKKGELLAEQSPGVVERWSLWRRFAPTDVFLSSSRYVSKIYAARFGLPLSVFLELGYPVHDELVERARKPLDSNALFPAWPRHRHAVLYAPTFRKRTPTRFFPFDDVDLPALARFLEQHSVLLMLRPHPNEPVTLDRYTAASERIVVLDQEKLTEVYEILPSCSAVISDYSALSLEAALIDVPSLLLPYDLNAYERGLAFDLKRLAPGPSAATQAEFLTHLERCFQAPESFARERESVRRVFFRHADGKAAERVANWLEQRLETGPRPELTRQLKRLWQRGLGPHVRELPDVDAEPEYSTAP